MVGSAIKGFGAGLLYRQGVCIGGLDIAISVLRKKYGLEIGKISIYFNMTLLLISIGFNPGGTAPIFTWSELDYNSFFVDPVPQALTLTSIVIGACVTAMSLALVIKLEEQYGTIDTREIRRLRG